MQSQHQKEEAGESEVKSHLQFCSGFEATLNYPRHPVSKGNKYEETVKSSYHIGAGKMAQQLRALVTLAENPGSDPACTR